MSARHTIIVLSCALIGACDQGAGLQGGASNEEEDGAFPADELVEPQTAGLDAPQLGAVDDASGPLTLPQAPEGLLGVRGTPTLGLVTTPVTVTVPGQFASITDALNTVELYAIRGAGEVTIQVSAGTYNLTAPIRPRHPDGARIRIVGDTSNPSSRVLSFSNVAAGLDLSGGYTLGAFIGFELRGGANAVDAVRVSGRATLIDGSDLIVDGWDDQGVIVTEHSYARVDRVRSEGNGGDGVAAYLNSTVIAEEAISYSNRVGFKSWMSAMYVQGAEATANSGDGFVAESGGVLFGTALAYSNGDDGFNAYAGGVFDVGYSVAADNGGEGYYLFAGSVMRGFAISTVPTVAGVDGVLPPAGNGANGLLAQVGSTAYAEASDLSENGANASNARNNSEVYVRGARLYGNGGCVYSEQDSHINVDNATCSTIGGTATSDDMWSVTGSYLSKINATGQAMSTANTTTADRSQIKQ